MTTSALHYTDTSPRLAKPAKTAQRPPLLPLKAVLNLLRQSLKMMQAIPDNGRISASQLARVRAMAERI